MKKENIKYILLIVFFTILLFLSPISGDDWGNYLVGKEGLRHIFGNAIGMYFDWEGRFISRLLINFFTYYKSIWNIVNAICIVGIIYLIEKIINPKNRKMTFLLTLLIILLMNIYTFSQVVVWVAGNITYLFVVPLLLYYFYYLLKEEKQSTIRIICFSILNFIMPMFIEHMGVILVFGNIFLLVYNYIKTKKVNKELLIYLVLSIIGLSLMLFSPGTMKRSKIENINFNKLNFLEKILYNIPNFIYYTYMIYPYLLILMIVGTYFLIKNINNKLLRIFLYCYSLLFLVIFLLNNTLTCNSIFIIIYFIIYTIITFILICLYAKEVKDIKIIFFYLLGIASNVVMLISPTWGFRTSFSTYIFLSICYLLIIDRNIREKNLVNNILLIISIIMILFYSILYILVAKQNKENIEIINKNKNSKVIEIYKYPDFVNCNINPENSFHLEKFKMYYGISQDTEIKLIPNKFKIFK